MSRRRNDNDEQDFLIFTPGPGFNIKASASHLVEMMEEQGLPLAIELPNVTVEFELGCTEEQVIDGYNQALRAQFSTKPSNANKRKPRPKPKK